MFDLYTLQARRAVFFARSEASEFGSGRIESHHLLLGLLRADTALRDRFLPSQDAAIRETLVARFPFGKEIPRHADLPLSKEAKHNLAYAQEEASRMKAKCGPKVRTEHLLLGLLREEGSVAAELLRERGLELAAVRKQIEAGPFPDQDDLPAGPPLDF
jgi:ATP-dependent Clp protease ATP-binding subunit ClpC